MLGGVGETKRARWLTLAPGNAVPVGPYTRFRPCGRPPGRPVGLGARGDPFDREARGGAAAKGTRIEISLTGEGPRPILDGTTLPVPGPRGRRPDLRTAQESPLDRPPTWRSSRHELPLR